MVLWLIYLVEGPDRGKAQCWFRRAAEELQDRHSGCQLLGRSVLHVDNSMGRLVNHHLTLVAQAALNEVKHGTV